MPRILPAVTAWPGWLIERDPNTTYYNLEVPTASSITGFSTRVLGRWHGFIYVPVSDYYKLYMTQKDGAGMWGRVRVAWLERRESRAFARSSQRHY